MKEADIRPKDLFANYLELNQRDVERLFADRLGFVEIGCPACGCGDECDGLIKLGFRYRLCADCGSLYLSPRPTRAQMQTFYAQSDAVKFWGTDFYRQTAESRRERLFRPRARQAAALADQIGLPVRATLADIGPGYGLTLEEAAATGRFARIIGIEPAANLAAICREKGFEIVPKLLEEMEEGEVAADIVTCFEVLEHVYDPTDFVMALGRVMRRGGRLLATTLTVTGFDIQVLWERSNSIHPPHHCNLLSVSGYRRLFERCGFSVADLSTPGELDVDLVRNKAAEDMSLPLPRFVRAILDAPEDVRNGFQSFLKASRLSSHICIVASQI